MVDIKIGTLSMERRTHINQPPFKIRRDKILQAAQEHDLDLLVCSGDFLDKKHLSTLPNALASIGSSVKVVVDTDGQTKKIKSTKKNTAPISYGQDLFLVEAGQMPQKLAKQVLVLSNQLRPPQSLKAQQIANSLFTQLGHRSFIVKGKEVSTMICGEINFYTRTRATGRVALFDRNWVSISQHFDAADIIVNPTHDRMASNRGALESRRSYLSRTLKGRKRCYISSSNWDIRKAKQNSNGHFKQTHKARGNQTIYIAKTDRTHKMKRDYDVGAKMLLSTITVSL